MSINDFDELRGLHGTRSEAATNSLVRYFQILKVVKTELRRRFSSEDLGELTDAVDRIYRDRTIGSDSHAVIATLADNVSSECAEILRQMSEVERIVFLDVVERTANVPKTLARSGAVVRFML